MKKPRSLKQLKAQIERIEVNREKYLRRVSTELSELRKQLADICTHESTKDFKWVEDVAYRGDVTRIGTTCCYCGATQIHKDSSSWVTQREARFQRK